ncbi:MAG: ribosome small subunit-dependent GTPase A [Planctomycetes bacterium]|nr:ribosome small subunit-dependent GTPase A [Planctomycetota bacterium]
MPYATMGLQPARVLSDGGNAWKLLSAAGLRSGEAGGAIRRGAAPRPAAGDWVATSGTDRLRIEAVLARRSCLARIAAGTAGSEQVIAANVDVACVVVGLDRDFNLRRLERYVVLVREGGAAPVVVLNKADLHADAGTFADQVACAFPGVPLEVVSAASGAGLDGLRRHLRPRATCVLLGSSGAGKSSLVNRLAGSDLRTTGAVRADDQRGRHTTTARELVALPGGALLLDIPGMRELHLAADAEAVDLAFTDLVALAAGCRFRDCGHVGEPGCAVAAAVAAGGLAVERLAAWRKLHREVDADRLRHDAGGKAEARARDRRFGRMVREAARGKRMRQEGWA